MKAFVHEQKQLLYRDMPEPVLDKGQIIVKIKAAGLNHRDLKIPERRSDGENTPLILGSDGTGIVESIGEGVTQFSSGDEVIINPGIGWKENSEAPPAGFQIVGMPGHGSFAERIMVSSDQLEKKPSYLNWEEAGVLALGGLTGYRALFTKGNLQPGQTVFIPGAGGGVSTFLIQFAKARGARVITTSRSETKREKALKIGADRALDSNGDWKSELKEETIDLVIEGIGKATFNKSLEVLKKGGRIVTFGSSTEDEITINIRRFFYGQYQLFGSTMGSTEELRNMLAFMEQHKIRPVIDRSYLLKDTVKAFQYLEASNQFGKIAIIVD